MRIEIVYNRRGKLSKKGKSVIEFIIYLGRYNQRYRSSGISIEEQYWDEKGKCVKNTHPDAFFLNAQLLSEKRRIERFIINEQLENDGVIDFHKFPRVHATNRDASLPLLFYSFFEQQVIKKTNIGLSKQTQATYVRILRYLKLYHPKNILLTEVTVSFLNGFKSYLIETKGLSNNSIAEIMSKVRKVINEAVRNDLLLFTQDPFRKGFPIRIVQPTPKSLTLNELRILEDLDLSSRPDLVLTRDMFLFSCYTSLRYSDVVRLSFENFEFLEDGRIRLKYTARKTAHTTLRVIEWIVSDLWNGKVDVLIKKYIDKYASKRHLEKEERLFFHQSNQRYYVRLKRLRSFSGIKEHISSHTARHTCITLLINDFGMDITKVQLIAGHSKIDMTRRYLRVTELEVSEAAKKINWNV